MQRKTFIDAGGDVPITWADTSFIKNLTGFKANVSLERGVRNFIEWY